MLDWFRRIPFKVRLPLFVIANLGALVLLGRDLTTPLGIGLAVIGGALLIGAWFLLTITAIKGASAGESHNRRALAEVTERLKYMETPALLLDAGLLHMRMGNAKAAREHLGRVLALEPKHKDALYYLGQLDLAEKRPKDAWQRLSTVYELDDNHDYGHIRLHIAHAYADLNEPEHALTLARQFLDEQPGQPAGLELAAAQALKLGKVDEARAHLRDLLDVAERAGPARQEILRPYAKRAKKQLDKLAHE